MADYSVSDRAEQDLLDIYVYGVGQFGRPQALAYQDDLESCFATLAEHPRIGRTSDTIKRGLRRHEHGSHVVLYKQDGEDIRIVAVVHGRSIRGLKL